MRVVVVGGGIVGLCCAYYLRRMGSEVTLVERDAVGGGCSQGNAGWICPSIAVPLPSPHLTLSTLPGLLRPTSPLYLNPLAAPGLLPWLRRFWRHCNEQDFSSGTAALRGLTEHAFALYDDLAANGVAFEMHTRGLLFLFCDDKTLAAEREVFRLTGHEAVRLLDGDGIRQAEPALAEHAFLSGALAPAERHVRPETVCAGLASALGRDGGTIREAFEIADLGVRNGRMRSVTGPSGTIEADEFVFATGAEAGVLSRLGMRLPLQAGKGYSVTVDRPMLTFRRAIYVVDRKVTITPFAGAHRVGGTMELSGVNGRVDRRRVDSLIRSAERVIPGVLAGGTRTDWVGMRPLTPDGLPVIGRVPGWENVTVATGHQMLGMTMGPGTGKAVAALVTGRSPEVDLQAFAVDRAM